MKTLIAFTGLKQSGKTTAAQYLETKDFLKLSFAEPIKDITWFLLQGFGLSAPYVNQLLTEHKEVTIPELGVSARYLMQTLGTEWGRKLVHPDLWVMSMSKRLEAESGDLFVFDDIRFANEAKMIRERGGLIIHVVREGSIADGHASESGITDEPGDCFISNNGTIRAFLRNVDALCAKQIAC